MQKGNGFNVFFHKKFLLFGKMYYLCQKTKNTEIMIAGIICGILAGFIACKLTNREGKGCIVDLFLGIVGGAVGGWIFQFLGIQTASLVGEIVCAVVGAVVVLWICNKLF